MTGVRGGAETNIDNEGMILILLIFTDRRPGNDREARADTPPRLSS